MFYRAYPADPDLSNWNFANVTAIGSFVAQMGISNLNYTNFLIQLEATTLQSGVTMISGAQYQAAASTARANLIGAGWSITDGGAE
jgi:hypothetical protein